MRTANVTVCEWAVLDLCFSIVQYAVCAHAQGMFSLSTYFVCDMYKLITYTVTATGHCTLIEK